MVPCEKILAAAREQGADIIGLIGPDHAVARRDGPRRAEMERQGFDAAAADRRRDDEPRRTPR